MKKKAERRVSVPSDTLLAECLVFIEELGHGPACCSWSSRRDAKCDCGIPRLIRRVKQQLKANVAVRRDAVAASPSTALLTLKDRAELAEATLERLALDATDGYVGGAQRLVLKWLQDTKANAGGQP